tara:strand:+ start:68 stop:736 length:669 start_codon:yes stop_codon:yes gene_type:complete
MNIKELAEKYELTKNDFWELRKNSGKWIITHDACEKIAVTEGIIFDPIKVISYVPTIITENGEKVQQVKWGKEFWKPAWAGTCQKKSGDVALIITGYKADNPDYKVETTGEANGLNCTAEYYMAMAEKRGKDRVILKLINAYEYGIYSDVEADDFGKHEKPPSESQIELVHNLATELDYKIMGVDKMNKEEMSTLINELKEEKLTKEAIGKAKEKQGVSEND